jgi:hypothetical protein
MKNHSPDSRLGSRSGVMVCGFDKARSAHGTIATQISSGKLGNLDK